MLKKINRLLKLVGLNLVRAKRKKVVKTTGLERYTPSDEVKLSDYMGESEWQSTPPAAPLPHPEGGTHFVGDGCSGGHLSDFPGHENVCLGVNNHEITRVEQPNSDNKISGPTS